MQLIRMKVGSAGPRIYRRPGDVLKVGKDVDAKEAKRLCDAGQATSVSAADLKAMQQLGMVEKAVARPARTAKPPAAPAPSTPAATPTKKKAPKRSARKGKKRSTRKGKKK